MKAVQFHDVRTGVMTDYDRDTDIWTFRADDDGSLWIPGGPPAEFIYHNLSDALGEELKPGHHVEVCLTCYMEPKPA